MIRKFRAATRDEKGQFFALDRGNDEILVKTTILFTDAGKKVATLKNVSNEEFREAETFANELVTAMSTPTFNSVLESWQILKKADEGKKFWVATTKKYRIYLRVSTKKAEIFVVKENATIPSIIPFEEEDAQRFESFLNTTLADLERDIVKSPQLVSQLSQRYAFSRLVANELKKDILTREERTAFLNGKISLDEVTSCFITSVIEASEEGRFAAIIKRIIKFLNEREEGENNGCKCRPQS